MTKLNINKSLDIQAPVEKVWQVLTEPQYSDQWSSLFSPETPGFRLEADWRLDGLVNWLGNDGKIVVDGKVTNFKPNQLLQFTVIDKELGAPPDLDKQDGIKFELLGQGQTTKLVLEHGDFGKLPEGQKYYDMTLESWEVILPEIKRLAEMI